MAATLLIDDRCRFDVVVDAPSAAWRPVGHGFRLLPHETDTDGMTLLRYRRRA